MMTLSVDMTNAPSEVVRLEGKLSNNDGKEINFDFDISENFATAFVEDVTSGIWMLRVDAFNVNDDIIYTGTTEITVYPGVVTPVSIHLNPTTGSLVITVTWGEICTDIDGNVYRAVKIGNQIWMAENLRVTHFRNGEAIPNVISDTEWAGLTTSGYCAYNNEDNNTELYGLIYNWYAVDDSRNISPKGWHVPTDEEWKELEMYLGMSQTEANIFGWRGTDEGGKIKTTGTLQGGDGLWHSPNLGATNSSGFSALPSYYRYDDVTFHSVGILAHFWSSTESTMERAWDRYVNYHRSDVARDSDDKRNGFSVRCIKDSDDQENNDDQFEENDQQSEAAPLIEYTYYHDLYVLAQDDDWYSMTISADSLSIKCDFIHSNGDINIDLVDENGTILESSKSNTDNERINYIVDQLGTYYIHVFLSSGEWNSYTFWWDDIWQWEY